MAIVHDAVSTDYRGRNMRSAHGVLLAGGLLLAGVFLGGLLGLTGNSPAFTLAFGVIALVSLLGAAIFWFRGERLYRSLAISLTFDKTDALCFELQAAKKPAVAFQRSVVSTATQSFAIPWQTVTDPLEGYVRVLRLRATNERATWLKNALVRVAAMHDDQGRPQPHADVHLRWIHDDDPPFPLSSHGVPCNPGRGSHMYIDLIFKVIGRSDFRVQFANQGLRQQDIPDGTYRFLLASSARDDDTDRRTPTHYQAFEVSVTKGGDCTITEKAPKEMGFQQ